MTSAAMECPMCGRPMRRVTESTLRRAGWERWQCPACLHTEQHATRECPNCHEVAVPLRGATGDVCPACGHVYEE